MTLFNRLKNKLILLIFLPCLAAYSSATSEYQNALEKVNYFSMGMNGFIGKRSEGERLYLKIMQGKKAREIFISIFNSKNSTYESKLYAACGLWRLDETYLKSLSGYQTHNHVSVLQGDILYKKPFDEELAKIISHGCD